MNNMERNRQIVQENLDKKANKRKKAIIDAEQEVITINMFKIVNANADCAEAKRQAERTKRQEERNKMITCKVNLRNSKRIATIKKRRNTAVVNTIASALALVAPIVFCALGKTELLNMIVTVAPIAFLLIFNLYLVLKTQIKLKKETNL